MKIIKHLKFDDSFVIIKDDKERAVVSLVKTFYFTGSVSLIYHTTYADIKMI